MSKDKKVVFVCSGCDKNTLNNDLEMFHYCISCLKKLKEEIKDVEYAKLLKDLEFDGLDSVSYEYGLKKGKEDASNVFLPEQGKNKHEIEVLKIELKRVSKLYNSALLSVPVSTDLEIEVRVREETTQKIEQEIKDEIIRKQKAGYSTPKLFNNKVQRVVYLEGFEDGLVFIEKFFKKRFLVKSEVQKE